MTPTQPPRRSWTSSAEGPVVTNFRDFQIISGDTHLEVSPDRWRPWVDPEFQDCVPKIIKLDHGGDAWVLPNSPAPIPLGANFAAGIDRSRWNGPISYDENPPGSGDPRQRVAEMDRDGVFAEIEFPAVQGQRSFHNLIPPEAYVAVVRGYNNWLSQEFCSIEPNRLLGCALLPSTSLDDAIAELERTSSMPGIRTAILHHWPNGGPFPEEEDDRFWQRALDLGFPLSIHVGLGSSRSNQPKLPKGHFNNITAFGTLGAGSYSQFSMIQFILTGVLDRFPELRLVFAEVGVGWLPNWLERLDHSYLRHQDWTGFEFKRMPSEYIRRHFLFGFQDDFYGVKHRDEIGVNKLMWANDFPHSAGDWPDSVPLIEKMFDGVPEDEARLMLGGNCARYYKLDSAATTVD